MGLRRKLCAAALAGALAAAMPSLAVAQETITITDDFGFEVTIPADPQRIVSLRDEHITAPLLELGAHLVASTGTVNPFLNGGAPHVRGAYELFNFRFEDSDIAYLGSSGNFDIEAVAAARPDLIIATGGLDRRDQLMAIAPVVFLSQESAGPGAEPLVRLGRLADVAGYCGEITCRERYDQLMAAFNARLDRYRAMMADLIPDPSAVTVAVIQWDNGTILQAARYSDMLTAMIDELGFSYPPIVAALTGGDFEDIELSPEQLPQLQSDFLISTVRWGTQNGSIMDKEAALDAVLPEWRSFVHAAQHDQWIFLEHEQSRPTTFTSARYTLDFLFTNIVLRPFVPMPASE